MKTTMRGPAMVLMMVAACTAGADEEASKSEAFPIKGWYVAPMFSYTRADDERRAGDGKGAWLAIGHRGDAAAIELAGIYTPMEHEAKLTGGALDVVVGPFADSIPGRFFGLVGFGLMKEQNIPALRKKHSSAVFGEAGVGYMQPLSLFDWPFGIRAEARYRYDYEQPPRPANTPSTFKEWVFNVGLQIPLSRPAPPPPPKPEPVAVVPVADDDHDGVTNDRDQCPATPAGAKVNEVGCPLPEPKCELAQPGQPITLEGCKAGDMVVLHGVTFATNKSELDPNAQTILDPIAGALNKHAELKIEISGHTDSIGSDARNQKLSERRAESVRAYLITKGVAGARMSAVGYGESKPIDGNDTDAGRARNRRVELKVLDAPAASASTAPSSR